ncbi:MULTISPECIES: hypothetical protein [unclassified Sphingobium]|uniref:hypothetical protein n=1 Tax=unclassified Sphingobium TaxID=2611147 RepID=UPI0035A60422
MKLLPISLTEPTLARIRGLRLTALRRPGDLLAEVQPGDRLWVREPFHLTEQWDHWSPTAARDRGAVPFYAIDGGEGLGRRRFAREMPREWHRMHLVLTAVQRCPLQSIGEDEALAEGYASRAGFAAQWDRENSPSRSITGDRIRWADNPTVTWMTFRPVFEPLSNAAFAARGRAAA